MDYYPSPPLPNMFLYDLYECERILTKVLLIFFWQVTFGYEHAFVWVSGLTEVISIINSFIYSFNNYRVPAIVPITGHGLWKGWGVE